MSASHEMVAYDVQRIESIARNFKATEIVEVTNKRTILWCPDLLCAKNLAIRISQEGFAYQLKPGLQTSAWYVQAFY